MTWQEPQADTVAVLSRPWAKDRKATMRGTRPMATKSQPRAVGATLAGRRLLQAKTRSARLRSVKAIPRPRNQSLVVPIQPRGNGTDSAAAAATGTRKTKNAVARAAAFTGLLASGVVLEPLGLDVLRLLLVLLAEQPLAALVEVVRLKAVLLRHRGHVAVLAVLRGHPRALRLRQELGRGVSREGERYGHENHRCQGKDPRSSHGGRHLVDH